MVEGVANAELIFNLVFFVVLLSVIFQGMTLPFASRYLDLNETKDKILERGDLENLEYFEENLIKVKTRRDGIIPGKKIMDLHFPKDILLILINRKGKKILPRGDTLIEAEDELYILADDPRIVEEYIMDSIKKISRENRD